MRKRSKNQRDDGIDRENHGMGAGEDRRSAALDGRASVWTAESHLCEHVFQGRRQARQHSRHIPQPVPAIEPAPAPGPAPRPRAVASFTQRVYFVSCWPGSCCDGLSASPNWAPCGLSAGHGTGNDIRARACPRGERRAPKLHASCVRAPALPEPRQSWCGCAHWRSGPSPSARPLSWAAELCSRGNKI